MSSHGLLQSLLRRWWVIAITVLAAVAAGYYHTARIEPIYRASATIVVHPSTLLQGNSDLLRSLDTLERRSVIATFAKIPGTREMKAAVASRLGLEPSALRRYRIRGSVVPSTNLFTIEVTGPDRELVEGVANATARRTRRKARGLYRVFALDVLEEARASSRPFYPDPQRNYVASAILGLFLGCGAALAFEQLRRPGSGAASAG